ncbi:unnamed protein product [Boreogadus saida]
MYQRIPAQFCSMLKDIGFQREYAPPYDPKYGEGIYLFVRGAVDLWREQSNQDVYQYYAEAHVLTRKSTPDQGLNTAMPELSLECVVMAGLTCVP